MRDRVIAQSHRETCMTTRIFHHVQLSDSNYCTYVKGFHLTANFALGLREHRMCINAHPTHRAHRYVALEKESGSKFFPPKIYDGHKAKWLFSCVTVE